MKAKSDTRLIDAPITPMVANAPIKEIGKPRATKNARDGRRKKDRTKNTRINPC